MKGGSFDDHAEAWTQMIVDLVDSLRRFAGRFR